MSTENIRREIEEIARNERKITPEKAVIPVLLAFIVGVLVGVLGCLFL